MTERRAKPVQKIRAALVREGDVIQMQGYGYRNVWTSVEKIESSPRGKVIYFWGTDGDWAAYRCARVNTLIGVKR